MNEILVDVFRFLHFIGLSALVGGLLLQIKREERRVNAAVLYGALTQFITGIVLLLLTLATANHLKVTVKIVVLLPILIITFIRRKKDLSPPLYFSMLILSVLNIGIAVFW